MRVGLTQGAGRGLYPHICLQQLQQYVQDQHYLGLLCSRLHVSLAFNHSSHAFWRWVIELSLEGKPFLREQSTARCALCAWPKWLILNAKYTNHL